MFLCLQQQLGITIDLEMLDYPFQQIPKMVRLFNRTEGKEKRLLIIQYVRQVVQQSLKYVLARYTLH